MMARRPRLQSPRARALAAALVPIVLGVVVMVFGGAPVACWGTQLTATALGVATLLLVSRRQWRISRRAAAWIVALALLAIATTLFRADTAGVRRWHQVGPLRLCPSALLLPLVVALAGRYLEVPGATFPLLLLAIGVALLLQPDAGQATAFGLAAAVLTVTTQRGARRYWYALLHCGIAATTWLRADPLSPAPFVEDIVGRSFAFSTVLGFASLASLLVLVLSPLLAFGTADSTLPSVLGLVSYLAGTVGAAYWGEFPVPLLGFGTSHVVGVFLGLAGLERLGSEGERPSPQRSGASQF